MRYYTFIAVLLLDTAMINCWHLFPEQSQWPAYMSFVAVTLAMYPLFIAASQVFGWKASKFAVIALAWHGIVQMLEIRDVLLDENTLPPVVELAVYFAGLALITAARYWVGDKYAHQHRD